ncbi:MAG: MFS transporter [Pirellulales bacterium]
MNDPHTATPGRLKWFVCGMLLLALVLNYMDRQTLSLTITAIEKQIQLSNAQYGRLEKGFGYAFALGGLLFGLLADKLSIRWLYPLVLLGWSAAGVATGFADRIGQELTPLLRHVVDVERLALVESSGAAEREELTAAYIGFLVCRVVLGLFEAGQWPCALVTTQRLLSAADRPFGNSILQSGASIGAILTPLVIGLFDPFTGAAPEVLASATPEQLGWWRAPYVVVGCLGALWVVPWLVLVWNIDLQVRSPAAANPGAPAAGPPSAGGFLIVRRLLALVVVVIVINMTWQFFRVWLPKMLEQYHHYSPESVRWFVTAYYIATDVGCIAAGASVKWLAARRWNVHQARVLTFSICAALTALSTFASTLPKGPLLLGTFLLIGFGALGLFPNYYSFTQEISARHQGRVSGVLGCITWVVTSEMQELVGKTVDATKSYASGIFWIGLAPAAGALALFLLWGRTHEEAAVEPRSAT